MTASEPTTTVPQALAVGVRHHRAGRLDDAEEVYRQVLVRQPGHADALHLLGMIAHARGRGDEAIALIRRAIEAAPLAAEYHNNLGLVLRSLGRINEAIIAYSETIRLKPDYAEAHKNLGFAYAIHGQLDRSIDCYRKAITLRPVDAAAHSHLLQTLHYHPGYDAQTLLNEHLLWAQRHAEPLASLIQPHDNEPDPDRPLRVGYVSADFRHHACAFYSEPLLAAHDTSQFEVVGYSQVAHPDEVTERIRSHTQLWREVRRMSDDQLANQIRADKIDILVDMSLHTTDNRLLVFARKPAPVQVTWLGYASTSGMRAIDYRITDAYHDPIGETDHFFTEESIRLETCWCFDPRSNEPAVNALPASTKGFITFGSMNNFCKTNDALLELWARLLRDVEGSRLLILSDADSHQKRTLDLFEQHGVHSDRIDFPSRRPRPQYLELFHQIDIALDMIPYNGVTTTLDALWMGVPVMTLAGQTCVSRTGLSLLTSAGLPELVARNVDEYVDIASSLAFDLTRLSSLRKTLRDRLRSSILMDAPRFARQMEQAYRAMWRRWCETKRAQSESLS